MANEMPDNDEISISCSWDVQNGRSIENALSYDAKSGERGMKDLECIVSLETCIELGTHDADLPCTIEIKLLSKNVAITEISVVSEARIIEVYGQCGEYLTTAHGEFIDECENMAVYMAEISIVQPSSDCLLKFARLRNKGRMWLYGIHITVDKTEQFSFSDKTVNFQNVNKILKDSSHQLTEKADKCKKFLQMYYTSYRDQSKTQPMPNPQALLKIFEAEYLTRCNPIGSHMSRHLADLIPALSPKGRCESSEERPSVASPKISTANSQEVLAVAEQLKLYIDQRFSQLEKILFLRIDDKFNELQKNQSEKLDQILHAVQNVQLSCVNKCVCINHVCAES
ncbi:uncharacterized protein [Anabrus simplex]|uniref:uncharacterized protein n=1 Tax=Anabrus simplex TaxID=316456 RepID=UPI0035A3CCE6